MSNDKKIAIVTGAAQGIGLAISKSLANELDLLIMTDVLEEKLVKEVNQLNERKNNVVGYHLDVGSEEEVKNLFEEIKSGYGRLDILVNNAGISPKTDNKNRRPLTQIPLDEWNQVLNINLTGSFLCIRESLPLMITNRWGRIVNISSMAGRTYSRVAGSHYAASKSGLIGLTRNVANEYGKYGITANCIAPGRITTPMVESAPSEKNKEFIDITPVKRLGKPEEIAAAVSFICSEEAGYINGTTLDINGGIFMN